MGNKEVYEISVEPDVKKENDECEVGFLEGSEGEVEEENPIVVEWWDNRAGLTIDGKKYEADSF